MTPSDSAPAKESAKRNPVGAAQVVAGSPKVVAKYCYVGVRCKTCLGEGRTTWLLIKYMGPDEGKTTYKLVLPPAPRMSAFPMYCEVCDTSDSYARSEAQLVSLQQPPPPEFVNQY